MLIRAFAALMMILMLGLVKGDPAGAATYSGNSALGGFEIVTVGAVHQDKHEHPARTGGEGNCHHVSVPCAPSFLFQRNSVLEYGESTASWAMPDGVDLKPIALKRDPPVPRPLR